MHTHTNTASTFIHSDRSVSFSTEFGIVCDVPRRNMKHNLHLQTCLCTCFRNLHRVSCLWREKKNVTAILNEFAKLKWIKMCIHKITSDFWIIELQKPCDDAFFIPSSTSWRWSQPQLLEQNHLYNLLT